MSDWQAIGDVDIVPEWSEKIEPIPEPVFCPGCKGAGWILTHRWKADSPQGMVPCPQCNETTVADNYRQKIVGESGLAGYPNRTFEGSQPRSGQLRAWDKAIDLADKMQGWLLLYGASGAGKTWIAMCIGNARLATGHPALFRVVALLLKELRATFNAESRVTFDSRLDAICTHPLLILDDLGAEHVTDWGREQIYLIINQRWIDRRPTIITTNMRPQDLDARIWARISDGDLVQSIEVTRSDSRP